MPFDIGIGGGQRAHVEEPERGGFPDNLNGALQYSLAHWTYKVMETIGGAMGAWVAGFGVQFLDRIEPGLVEYAAPLLDILLAYEELDPALRSFLEKLRNPTHEAAATLLSGFGSQVGGAIMGSALGSLTAGLTYAVNRANRPALPSLADAITMDRRGLLPPLGLMSVLTSLGYHDVYIDGYKEITKLRASLGDLFTAYKRGELDKEPLLAELSKRGLSDDSVELLIRNAREFLDVQSLFTAWHRGMMTEPELRGLLQKRKFRDDDIDTLEELSHPIPGPTDLVRMGVREAFNDDVAVMWGYDSDFPPELREYMTKLGFDPDWAKYYWRSHWELPSVSQAFEMFHRGEVGEEELEKLLRALDIPARWRRGLTNIAYSPYTRVDVRRMYGLGVLDEDEVKAAYMALGYDDDKAEHLKQFTILYEKPDDGDQLDEFKDLTRAVVTQAYAKGIIERTEATTRLMALDYTQENIDLLLELATWTKEIDETPDYMREYQKDVKSIIEKAYSRRLVSANDAKIRLTELGFGDSESDYILGSVDFWYGFEALSSELTAIGKAFTSGAYNRGDTIQALGELGVSGGMQSQVLGTWDISLAHRSRRLSEAQYRKAMQGEVISVGEYQENMRGLGYSNYDVWVLTAMAQGVEAAGPKPREGPGAI